MGKFYDEILYKTPNLSSFDRTYNKRTSMQFNKLYPTFIDEVLPSDIFKISQDHIARFAPMVTPAFGDIRFCTHFFFVPNRIISQDWEDFISMKKDHRQNGTISIKIGYGQHITDEHPYYCVKGTDMADNAIREKIPNLFGLRSLADYLGVPPLMDYESSVQLRVTEEEWNEQNIWLDVKPFVAYQKIYNDYYRDENLHCDLFNPEEYDATEFAYNLSVFTDKGRWKEFCNQFRAGGLFYQCRDKYNNTINSYDDVVRGYIRVDVDIEKTLAGNEYWDEAAWCNLFGSLFAIRTRCWHRDYFTSALGSITNGEIPIVPVKFQKQETFGQTTTVNVKEYGPGTITAIGGKTSHDEITVPGTGVSGQNRNVTTSQTFSSQLGFTISQLRIANALQKFEEKIVRAGNRYIEQLASHFGVIASDYRLQRPQYIGGNKSEVYINEVTQTSESSETSAQGNYSGQMISADKGQHCEFYSEEHGFIIGITSIVAKPSYQNGISRMWSRHDPLDYYFPEFAQLTEEPILQKELYVLTDAQTAITNPNLLHNNDIFAYQGRYDDYRYRMDEVSGELRRGLDSWHFGRKWRTPYDSRSIEIQISTTQPSGGQWYKPSELDIQQLSQFHRWSTPEKKAWLNGTLWVKDVALSENIVPTFNIDFIESDVSTRPFALSWDTETNDDYIYCTIKNHVTAVRPMPEHNQPAL